MNINLYTTECPRCIVLEKKMNLKNINYNKITDFNFQKFIDMGYDSAPILEIDGNFFNFKEAVDWLNREGN